MHTPDRQDEDILRPEELQQLDKLLANARNFHYTSVVLAGISLAVSTFDRPIDITLPVASVVLPRIQATIVIYLLVLIFVWAADRLLSMARPWMNLDPRRPPFAWFVLGVERPNATAINFWFVVPVLVCAITSASILRGYYPIAVLVIFVFSGVVAVFSPRRIYRWLDLMRERSDHRGGRATYSMYLYYADRVTTDFLLTLLFISPVLAIVPTWAFTIAYVAIFVLCTWAGLFLVRLIAGITEFSIENLTLRLLQMAQNKAFSSTKVSS